jgi:hypothetical protein
MYETRDADEGECTMGGMNETHNAALIWVVDIPGHTTAKVHKRGGTDNGPRQGETTN